jgi:GT2 family glycosyltransferase
MVFFSNMIPTKYINFPFDLCLNHFNFDTYKKNSIEISSAFASITNNQININPLNIVYNIELKNSCFTTHKKNIVVICTKDLGDLLNYTLNKLLINNVFELADVLIVDDRSKDDSILELAQKYNTSYLKINNNQNIFHYSNLNNFAVTYAIKYQKNNVIFWNNDLWPSTPDTLNNLLEKHSKYNSNLSGSKLIYPSKQDYSMACGNYNHIIGQISKYFLTIQHGGMVFLPHQSYIKPKSHCLKPFHAYRFDENNTFLASQDTATHSVTGAIHITNIKDFIDVGGLNISMSHTMQDIDLCLRYISNNKKVMYLGSEHLFHAETISGFFHKVNSNIHNISDNILYEYMWLTAIKKIIGLNFINDSE